MRQLLSEMVKIAEDTFPKSIIVEGRLPGDLRDIEGDATEVHQMLMNLCVNARDAMPTGGKLTIAAQNVLASAEFQASHPAVQTTPHIMLSVADTGAGIPPELQTRIFEPFFTTKGPEKGTGLGLSTVATLVKRCKGFLEVKSEPGKGSEFRIYLPAAESKLPDQAREKQVPLPSGHGETILLADDEQMVLELAKTTLENYGYHVLTAADGLEAIARFESHRSEISLVVMDTDMPLLNGLDALVAIRKMSPDIPVIIASATAHDTERLVRANPKHTVFLPKPYDISQLLKRVASMLVSSASPGVDDRQSGTC
jgi:CheY-like chemotaxis protein